MVKNLEKNSVSLSNDATAIRFTNEGALKDLKSGANMTTPIISDRAESKLQSQRTRNILLWVVQGVLAALFLFAGGMKLVMPSR
jgi:hypothetical protein